MTQMNYIASLKPIGNEPFPVQISTLRKIKNDIAGHELRKRKYVQEGLVPCVGQIIVQLVSQTGADTQIEESLERLWAQACDVINIVAHGGCSFTLPILHSAIPSSLLACASQTRNRKRALSALRALNAIADNLPVASPEVWTPDGTLSNLLYSGTLLKGLTHWIDDASTDRLSNQALVEGGILDSLCVRLAKQCISQSVCAIANDFFWQKAPLIHCTHLSPVLETIGVIVGSSRRYATMTLTHPTFRHISATRSGNGTNPESKGEWFHEHFIVDYHGSIDRLLPHVPDVDGFNQSGQSSFPPLGSAAGLPKRRTSSMRPTAESKASPFESDNPESSSDFPLVSWLLLLVRQHTGRRRLLASRLLVAFHRFRLISAPRSRSLRSLLAPLLVQMLDDESSEDDENSLLLTRLPYVQAVPAAIAYLVENDEDLQNVVVEAKAISKLACALKANFDDFTADESVVWKPYKLMVAPSPSAPPECTLGSGGPSARARHIMIHREGLLGALAAIAPDDDHHRKEVCDQGVLTQIMLALEPFESNTQVTAEDGPTLKTTGNSASTLLAACDAVRALTRSVTALRTKLVDADVSKAIVKLMSNPDPEVRIAATKVITNLVIDFSPMKATINTSEMIKKLCQQVHSANATLRLESIWALKNLAFNAEIKEKREIIDELGANWIRHLLATDPYDIPPGEVIGLEEKDHPPRTYRISGDVVMGDSAESTFPFSQDLLREMGNDDKAYNKHTIEDDLGIQHHLLDLVRNLFSGVNASEVVEYLIGEIGTTEFMRILHERLKSKVPADGLRRASSESVLARDILFSVLGVIAHIAASTPKLRTLLTSSTQLMKQVASLCTHNDHQIRLQCCWIVVNLIYEDDSSDRQGCQRRALSLHQTGFAQQMKRLENDPITDVQERAKTACDMLARATS